FRPVSHLGERLAQLAWGLVTPATLVEDVKAEKPVEGSPRSAVLALDGPSPPGTARDAELDPGAVEAALGAHREGAAERVQSEERIGIGDDVDSGDRKLWDQIPVDRVAEPIVEAYAVQIHGQPDGAPGQRPAQEAPISQVALPGIALGANRVDRAEVAKQMLGQIDEVLVLDVLGRHALRVAGILVERHSEGRNRSGADDPDGR